jgi:hypothetical protein
MIWRLDDIAGNFRFGHTHSIYQRRALQQIVFQTQTDGVRNNVLVCPLSGYLIRSFATFVSESNAVNISASRFGICVITRLGSGIQRSAVIRSWVTIRHYNGIVFLAAESNRTAAA